MTGLEQLSYSWDSSQFYYDEYVLCKQSEKVPVFCKSAILVEEEHVKAIYHPDYLSKDDGLVCEGQEVPTLEGCLSKLECGYHSTSVFRRPSSVRPLLPTAMNWSTG